MDFSTEPGPKIGSVIRGRAPSTSLSYHESGSHLFIASSDSTLRIIDCLSGKPPTDRASVVKLQGIKQVKSTHSSHCALVLAGGNDGVPKKNSVYYLSVHDNKILREFTGHLGVITTLSMNPADDTFLSSSVDGTVKLWDLRNSGNSVMELKLPGNVEGSPLAVFDSTGLVFGVSAAMPDSAGYYVNLYDARNYSQGPFSEMKVKREDIERKISGAATPERAFALSKSEWTSIEFNKSGKQILACANNGVAVSIDGYDGRVEHGFVAEVRQPGGPHPGMPIAACFTPDDRSVVVGNDDGSVSCYQASSGLLARRLRGHVDRVGAVASNPKYCQIGTACTNTAIWVW